MAEQLQPSSASKSGTDDGLGAIKLMLKILGSTAARRESMGFLRESVRILRGDSALDTSRDPRFRDEAWQKNPVYRRLGQSYLALCQSLDQVVGASESDWQDKERAKLLLEVAEAMLAPTNSLLGNPAAIKKAIDSRGMSLVRGTRQFVDDMRNNRGMPSIVDSEPFVVGENMAVTPGAVVYRNDQLEVLQYAPTTAKVFEIPLLVMTPQINKYYFLDLAPERSFVEFLTSSGFRVFIVSWKNPGEEERRWRLDDYVVALGEAVSAVRQICGTNSINTFGFCAGGITMSAYLCYLAHHRQLRRINTVSYAVTLMDFSFPASLGAFRLRFLLDTARKNAFESGILKSEDLTLMFNLLRPNDLIFNYWVNNYLMGNEVPKFDILAWNVDGTNLPEGLLNDFLSMFENNLLAQKGTFKVLGAPIDLKRIKKDAFVVGAVKDHLTPWTGCYATTQLLGGTSEFVLSASGHIAGLINPPGNPKMYYLTGPEPGADPEAWQAAAQKHSGSWWEHWVKWASTRSGRRIAAPRNLGSSKYPPLADAPGTYVLSEEVTE